MYMKLLEVPCLSVYIWNNTCVRTWMQSMKVLITNEAWVLLHCSRSHRVRSSRCLATCSSGLFVVCLISTTHSYTHAHKCAHIHTHTVCSPAAIICWHEHTPARALRGVGGLWVGGQVFWQALRSSPRTLGCLSQTPLLSTQGLFYQVSVTIALCLSLQIANRCPSRSRWVTCHRGEGGWDYAACNRITSEMLAVVCCRWCAKHSSLLGLPV